MIWVAELGSMHKGNPHLAVELIRQAKQAGANIAKFQFGWTKEAQKNQKHIYNEIRYIDTHAEMLKEACDRYGIELMASLWSDEGLETARKVGMKRYKIAHQLSCDPNYVGFIKRVLADNKQTFISIADNQFIEWMLPENAYFLFTTSSYPTYNPQLPDNFSLYTGYSDHSHGIGACLFAVAHGAQYIEKHFCLDKTDLAVRDTVFSATPVEFSDLVKYGNEMVQ
jgi:N,N'-diacetyllegionaminate synthase